MTVADAGWTAQDRPPGKGMNMEAHALLWVVFGVTILTVLTLDLAVLHRKPHVVQFREAAMWSAVWIALALLYKVLIAFELGTDTGITFLTGYLIELSLSVDNLFVFLLLFSYFEVPDKYQHRVLFWGILGAIIMRAIMIAAGVTLVNMFHWIIYFFGVFLVFTGIKMAFGQEKKVDPRNSRSIRIIKKFVPFNEEYDEGKFITRVNGRRVATLLLLVLITIEMTDLVFAVDSIPAILAITTDPFVVFTSNIFAISGLRSFYFALAGFMRLFQYLHYGLAFILTFVGVKMIISDFYKIPTNVSLSVIVLVLCVSIVVSLIVAKKRKNDGGTMPDTDTYME